MNNKEVPVLLLTGYLGSGKTTLLNKILANKKGIKFALSLIHILTFNGEKRTLRTISTKLACLQVAPLVTDGSQCTLFAIESQRSSPGWLRCPDRRR